MLGRLLRALAPLGALIVLTTLACDLPIIGELGGSSKPQVVIQSPASNMEFREGDEVAVQSLATDAKGITRVELLVDGANIETSAPPIAQGQSSFTVLQRWKATAGSHTLSVRAYNATGAASEVAVVTINVTASAQPSPVVAPTALVQVPPANTPLPGIVPTAPPSETVAPLGVAPTATRTRTPVPAVRATSTPSAPPGVYALSIRVEPSSPKIGQKVGFFVTFLNTTGTPQSYSWRIAIFEPDKRSSFSDTAIKREDIPVGTTELASIANWTISSPTPCRTFIGRVFWIDVDNNRIEFLKPDKSGSPSVTFPFECP